MVEIVSGVTLPVETVEALKRVLLDDQRWNLCLDLIQQLRSGPDEFHPALESLIALAQKAGSKDGP